MKKVIIGVLAVVAVGLGVWKLEMLKQVQHDNTEDKPTIKIGASLPLTGDLSFAGLPAKAGLEMTLENMKQKDLKYNYELVFEDNMGNVAKTASSTQKLMSLDNAKSILSLWNFMGAVVANAANPKGVINMTCSWEESSLYGPYSFNAFSTHQQIAELMLKTLKNNGVNSVAIINEAIADTLVKYIEEEANKVQISITSKEQVTTGYKNYKAELMKAASNEPDMFIVIVNPPLTYPMIKQLIEITGKKNITTVEVFTALDEEQKKIVDGLWFVDSNTFGSFDFQKELKSEKNIEAQSCSGNLSANLQILVDAYENTGVVEGEAVPNNRAVVEYIKQKTTNKQTVSGKANIMDNGLINIKPSVKWIRNGQVTEE